MGVNSGSLRLFRAALDDQINCFKVDSPLTNGRQEFNQRAAAFFDALQKGLDVPMDANDPFVDLEPEAEEEENSEVVIK